MTLVHRAPAESPRLRVGASPPEDGASLPVVPQVQPTVQQTDPGLSPGHDFAFAGLASVFPSVKCGYLTPVPLPRLLQGLEEAEDG